MGPGAAAQGQRLASGEVTLEELSAEIQEILDAEAGHFDSPGRELGFCYENGALVPDGTAQPEVEDPDRDDVPCARPGARAPHLWLQRDGKRISTLDLYGGGFVLLASIIAPSPTRPSRISSPPTSALSHWASPHSGR